MYLLQHYTTGFSQIIWWVSCPNCLDYCRLPGVLLQCIGVLGWFVLCSALKPFAWSMRRSRPSEKYLVLGWYKYPASLPCVCGLDKASTSANPPRPVNRFKLCLPTVYFLIHHKYLYKNYFHGWKIFPVSFKLSTKILTVQKQTWWRSEL